MDVNTPAAEPSTAAIEVPRSPEDYAKWRQTGELPGERTSKAASTPAKEPSAAAAEAAENDAPASDAGESRQERKRSNAETRLNEILSDLKRAGLSPSELKTYKRQAQEAAAEGREAPKPPESTEKPEAPQPPTYEASKPKPKMDDFDSIEQFVEAMGDWKADKRDFEREQREKAAATQKEVNARLEAARERYGAEADKSIAESGKALFQDAKIPSAVKALINDSDVMVDVLYTLGSKESDLQEFIALAKANPGQAIRKLVLLERLVTDELGKSASGEAEAGRDESGKFVSSKPPAKKVTNAPPPPREASGRSAAPSDEVESAAKAGDFAAYKAAANRRDMARLRGN